MNTWILIFILSLLFFIAYNLFNNDLFSPACIFCMAFIISSINLLMNTDYWKVETHQLTIVVICLGVLSFIIGAYIAKRIGKKKKKVVIEIRYINVNRYLLDFWILFELFVIILVVRFLISVTRANLFSAIAIFREASFTDEPISYPWLVSQLYFVGRRSGYFWAYIIVNNYFAEKKIDMRILICYMISACYPILAGERGSIVELFIGTFALITFFYQFRTGNTRRLKFRYVLLAMVVASIGLYIFAFIGTFIGREVLGMGETISIYLGAPVLNLNHWLTKNIFSERIWDHATLTGLIDFIRPLFDGSSNTGSTGMGYRIANGHLVGNVYTTFAAFYFDYGIFGIVLFSSLMGFMIECLYKSCQRGRGNNHLKFIVMAFLYPLVFFSFFANRFFIVFDQIFVKSLIVWIVLVSLVIDKKIILRKV